MTEHTMTMKMGPSGVRAECSCGWGGMPRYSCVQAGDDHAAHVHATHAEARYPTYAGGSHLNAEAFRAQVAAANARDRARYGKTIISGDLSDL